MVGSVKIVLVSVLVLAVVAAVIFTTVSHFKGANNHSTKSAKMLMTSEKPVDEIRSPDGTSTSSVANQNSTTMRTSASPTTRLTTSQVGGSTTSTAGFRRTIYSSALTNTSATFCRRGPCSDGFHYYEALKITVNTAGNYTIRSNSTLDTFGYLYNNNFDTTYPLRKMLQFNDDDAGSGQFLLSMWLKTTTDYIVVATTFFPFVTGVFSVVVQGPAAVSMSLTNATASPAPTQSFYTSALTSNSLYSCTDSNCSANGLYYYQPIGFMTARGGDYDIQSNRTFNIHGFIVDRTIHQLTDPGQVLMHDDDVSGDTRFLLTISLRAMFNYTLVVITYYPSRMGSFSVSAAGDPPLTFFAL